MNRISHITDFMKQNLDKNIKKYNLSNLLSAHSIFSFNNYIDLVKSIDDISYDFSTFLYSSFIEQIDNAFFNSSYRRQFCDVINISERNIITLFGKFLLKEDITMIILKMKIIISPTMF